MAEQVTLTTPVTKPSLTGYTLDRITIDVTAQSILIQWLGNNGEAGSASYPTPAPQGSSQPSGATLLHNLNTANFSVNSLVKQIFQRLQTDGYIASGNISGTPA